MIHTSIKAWKKAKQKLNESVEDSDLIHAKKNELIWYKLNNKYNDIDIYAIAKANNLLDKGQTKAMWQMRGGLILHHLADKIIAKPELAKLFGISLDDNSTNESLNDVAVGDLLQFPENFKQIELSGLYGTIEKIDGDFAYVKFDNKPELVPVNIFDLENMYEKANESLFDVNNIKLHTDILEVLSEAWGALTAEQIKAEIPNVDSKTIADELETLIASGLVTLEDGTYMPTKKAFIYLNQMKDESKKLHSGQSKKNIKFAPKSHLDKVGEEDADINNDGEVNNQDAYLKNRRNVIAKNENMQDLLYTEADLEQAFDAGQESINYDDQMGYSSDMSFSDWLIEYKASK